MDVEEEYPSDTSDEDYVPDDVEAVSEEEESGEDEGLTASAAGKDEAPGGKKSKKKVKRKDGLVARKRKGGICLEEEKKASDSKEQGDGDSFSQNDSYNEQLGEAIQAEKQEKQVQDEKKRADSLWADFMKDVGGPKPKPKASSSGLGSLATPVAKSSSTSSPSTEGQAKDKTKSEDESSHTDSKPGKVTITKEYDFAGEVVKITKEVDANSKEAKVQANKEEKEKEGAATAGPSLAGLKRPGGGLSSVLGKINKKQKISTLEKSKLDWNSFKTKEGINEELQIHNRGKDGYLERMAFLERTDHRQFEIEKNLRLSNSKR